MRLPGWQADLSGVWRVLEMRSNTALQKNGDRRSRAAASRYLSYRIDRETTAEDVQLSVWSNESMMSKAFSGFYLSDLEYGVRTHHDHLRAMLPVLELAEPPDDREMSNVNEAMRSRR
jgi:hypothetical protein